MLVFSEGVPRSGKSYDAVKNHILPALKKGRHVYARLNGLNAERIAAHIGKPVEFVTERLHLVGTAEVVPLFQARQHFTEADTSMASPGHEGGQWTIDDKFKNALVVIDEVHEFYLGGTRVPLDPASEQFFALHGHYGMDVLVLTQFYKRVHTALRFRIERKNTFQKLSALGKRGEGMYRETAYQTIAPDKYEKLGGRTLTYDPKIYPLYHGILGGTDGDVTQEVYEGGRTSVWRSMALRAAIVVPLAIWAVWYLVGFFTSGGAGLVDLDKATIGATSHPARPVQGAPMQAGAVWQQPSGMAAGGVPAPAEKVPTKQELALQAMTSAQRYIWDMAGKGRIRYTGGAVDGARVFGWLEWFDTSGNVLDRLALDQVRAMGVEVTVAVFGVELIAQGESIIATAWPLNKPVRDEQPRLYRLDGGEAAGVRVSEANPHAGSAPLGIGTSGVDARYGQFRDSAIGPDRYEASSW